MASPVSVFSSTIWSSTKANSPRETELRGIMMSKGTSTNVCNVSDDKVIGSELPTRVAATNVTSSKSDLSLTTLIESPSDWVNKESPSAITNRSDATNSKAVPCGLTANTLTKISKVGITLKLIET